MTGIAAIAVIQNIRAKQIMLTSLVALMGTTLLYCFTTNPWMIIVARFAQGASNAILNVVGLTILVDRFGPGNQGKAFGYIGMATAVGCVSGPVVGGVVHDTLGYVAVLVCIAAFVAVCAVLMLAVDNAGHELDEEVIEGRDAETAEQSDRGGDANADEESPDSASASSSKGSSALRMSLSVLGLVLSALMPCTLDTVRIPLQYQRSDLTV